MRRATPQTFLLSLFEEFLRSKFSREGIREFAEKEQLFQNQIRLEFKF